MAMERKQCFQSRGKFPWAISSPLNNCLFNLSLLVSFVPDLSACHHWNEEESTLHGVHSFRTPLASRNAKAKSLIREYLRLIFFPLCSSLPLWCFYSIFEKCLDLQLPLLYDYQNFMKLSPHWDVEFEVTEICFPGSWSLIFGPRTNQPLPCEARGVVLCGQSLRTRQPPSLPALSLSHTFHAWLPSVFPISLPFINLLSIYLWC